MTAFDRLYYWARSIQWRSRIRLPESIRAVLRSTGYAVLRKTRWALNVPLPQGTVIRIPAYLYRVNWDGYEVECMDRFLQCCRDSVDRPLVVLDIGSSIGIYSCAALFADPRIEVIAFDSDLVSLRLVLELVRHAPHPESRLHLIHGYLDGVAGDEANLGDAETATRKRISNSVSKALFEETSYRNLADPLAEDTPIYALDSLLGNGQSLKDKRVLLKCDVEGAEVRVLRGAEELLRVARPQLLLSVHREADLARHGTTLSELQTLLRQHRYQVTDLGHDHESHWWCTPEA